VRLDGHSATDVIDAVLTLMPLDGFVDAAAIGMEVVGKPEQREQTHADFDRLIRRHDPDAKPTLPERVAFYERVKTCYAIVQTGERRLYGNVVLKKGIIRPQSPPTERISRPSASTSGARPLSGFGQVYKENVHEALACRRHRRRKARHPCRG